ncbi:DUF2306 domain-containing protein [Nocardiopsis ganjiahuensis]|uniref:DUF2306 domain-containing protein n=1 Tax=Nocardiopsis ganjiahuensis TaxID=239984 RepID=UPI00034A224F|nr:DUF2306 domain-containing protein [Nocardiopsis ganjiahuensis]
MTRLPSGSGDRSASPPTVAAPQRTPAKPPPVRWWQRPWILPLALLTLVFLAFSVPPYLNLDPATAPIPIRPEPAWYHPLLLSHIFGGAVLMVVAIGQVWPWLRRRRPALHRWSGRVYVFFGVPFVGVPALLIAPLSNGPLAIGVNNVAWAVGWLAFVLLGYAAARRRRFDRHREWMLRSVVLLYGVALARFTIIFPIAILMPWIDTRYEGGAWALAADLGPNSLLINTVLPLLALEWWFKYRKPRRRNRPARATGKDTVSPATPAPTHTA